MREVAETTAIVREKLGQILWSQDTSSNPESWSPENPTYGHCAIVSLVVQDVFGGELLRAEVQGVSSVESFLNAESLGAR